MDPRWRWSPVLDAAPALLLVGLLLALSMPMVQAQEDDGSAKAAELVVHATAGRACPDGREFCLLLPNGTPPLEPGQTLIVRASNIAGGVHDVHIKPWDLRDPDRRDTATAGELAATGELTRGKEDIIRLTVPDAAGLYLWCEVTGHEGRGMWAAVPIGNATLPAEDLRYVRPAPAPGVFWVVAALGGLAVGIRRGQARRSR